MVAQQLAHGLLHALQGALLRHIFLRSRGSGWQRAIAWEGTAYLQDFDEAVVLLGRSGEAPLHVVNEGLGILHAELGLLLRLRPRLRHASSWARNGELVAIRLHRCKPRTRVQADELVGGFGR